MELHVFPILIPPPTSLSETMLLINIINTFSFEFIFIEYIQNAIHIQIISERQGQSTAHTQIVWLDKGELLAGNKWHKRELEAVI